MNEIDKLLEYVYQVSDMGLKNTNKLLKLIESKNNKITTVLEDIKKSYGKYKQEAEKYLNFEKEEDFKDIVTEISTSIGMKVELLKDNSDSKIAEMLIQGFTMGEVEIEQKINQYSKNSEKEIIKIAKELKKFQQNSIEKLKSFL